MLRQPHRTGGGASTSLTPAIHPEDAQPNEVSKKRKGQGLPPIVASSVPPIRAPTNYRGTNYRGRGGPNRGSYRGSQGGHRSPFDINTHRATRGGKPGWRGHRNPSGSWPRPGDAPLPAAREPGKPALSIVIPMDKGKEPIRGGRSDTANQWNQRPDSGYGQRAVPRSTAGGPSHVPHLLPEKPPAQASLPVISGPLFQPGSKPSKEWYMRTGSPEPKLPPGSLGRKNPQPPATISIPLPGRLRKLATAVKSPVQQEPEVNKSLDVDILSLVPPNDDPVVRTSGPSSSQRNFEPQPNDKQSHRIRLPSKAAARVEKPKADKPNNLPFIPPQVESGAYLSAPLSLQRRAEGKSNSTTNVNWVHPVPPRMKREPSPILQVDKTPISSQDDSLMYPRQSTSQSKLTSNTQPQATSINTNMQPYAKPKAAPVIASKPIVESIPFIPPLDESGAYKPVSLSLQRKAKSSLGVKPAELEIRSLPYAMPQGISVAHVPAPVSLQRKPQSNPLPQYQYQTKADAPRPSPQFIPSDRVEHHPQTHPKNEDTLLLDTKRHISSANETLTLSRIEPRPPTYDVLPLSPVAVAAPSLPHKQSTPSHIQQGTERTPPTVVKEEQLSPVRQSPIKLERRLVTEAASFYPIPESCSKSVPAHKENRKAFFKEQSRALSVLGLKRTKAFFRDDGLVIEWKSDVPVWSDTLKPEVNNLATAMEDFLARSAQRSGKRKRDKDGRDHTSEISPGSKRSKVSKDDVLSAPSDGKRKISEVIEIDIDSPPDKRRKTNEAYPEAFSTPQRRPISTAAKTQLAVKSPMRVSMDDATSKDDAIYISSSPEPSPKPVSRSLPTAVKKVPLPTRLHPTNLNGVKGSKTISTGVAACDTVDPILMKSAAPLDSGKTREHILVKMPTSQTLVAPGPPPLPSSKRMIFKPNIPPRTSRVTPLAQVSACAPAEDRGISATPDSVALNRPNSVIDTATPLQKRKFEVGSPTAGHSVDQQVEDVASGSTTQFSSIRPDALHAIDRTEANRAGETWGISQDPEVASSRSRTNNGAPSSQHLTSIGGDTADTSEDAPRDDDSSDIYCSEHEDGDEEEEDNESKLALDFFTRFITLFDSDRSKLEMAYAKNALLSCRVHHQRPHSISMAGQFAPEPRPFFHSSHSNASASTVERGRTRICDRLRSMGPHKFRALPGSVFWDLAPLPLEAPGHLMFSVHGEVVHPNIADRNLDHILTVDQTFVLRPRTDDDISDEELASNPSTARSEPPVPWPLVAISHQMTVRESRLLAPDTMESLLPWFADVVG